MMINRVSRKDPRFLPNPSGLCPCGSGKILAQCCRRFDGVVFKEPSAIRPPGPPTGYSHPRCYLGFTQNCCSKISGEHFVSQGILRQIGQSVSITGAPWLKTGEIKTLATKNLTANILCVRHNSAFSDVDTAAIRLFKFVTEINADLAQKSLSRKKKFYVVSGDDLEMWATKALLGLFHSQPKNTELAEYIINPTVVEDAIRMARLPKSCGIYLNARLGTPRVHHENEITVGTITLKEERRLIGLVIDIGGVSFDFLMDPLGVNTLRQGETKLYRPAHLMFEGRGRAHVIFLCWSSDHSEDGVVFTRNLNAEAAARLRSKLRRSKRQ
jgi:hypothetical protein